MFIPEVFQKGIFYNLFLDLLLFIVIGRGFHIPFNKKVKNYSFLKNK